MLRGGLLVAIAIYVALTAVRTSPLAVNKQEVINIDSRYSDNVLEDAYLDGPDLIRKYLYPVEVHTVTTEDGYILQMHRIPYGRLQGRAQRFCGGVCSAYLPLWSARACGRDANNVPNQRKPVVFVMHGLLGSSADFVLMGPGSGLAYILAEEGFDVWMGNARGNYYSRKHVTLNPDAILNTAFWNFSWDEIGNLDLPAMIDYVMEVTGEERLHYVGFSQGTTSFFVMGSLRPAYNDKIISMQALAPAAYMANSKNLLFNSLAPFSNDIQNIASLVGVGEFLPNTIVFTWAGEALCRDEVVFQEICTNIIFLIGGWDEAQLNATMLPVIFGHAPAGCSVKQLTHYGQGISKKGFRRYDQGSPLANYLTYGSFIPPSYDLSKVTAPVFLHYSEGDSIVDAEDVNRLFEELGGNVVNKYLVPFSRFSHLDFIYAINAKELVYDRVIDLIKAMNTNAFIDHV